MNQGVQCQHDRDTLSLIARRAASIVGTISFMFLSGCSGPDLKVELMPVGKIWVTNTGHEPVRINGLKINDRDDCKVMSLVKSTGSYEPQRPIELKIGELQGYSIHTCDIDVIVRVSVATNKGTATYSFR